MRLPPLARVVFGILAIVPAAGGASKGEASDLAPRLRRPVALVPSPDGRWLYVANRRSGTVSVIDLASRKTTAEFPIGKKLSDLVRADENRLLAVDEERHELVLLRAVDDKVEILTRLRVSPYPIEAVVTQDGRRAFIAALWSHRVVEAALPPEGKEIHITRVLDLPFSPRKLLLVREEARLLVADAFGGRLGVVDPATGELLSVRAFPAHNVRGLAATPDGRMLAVAHQMLNELAHTVRNDVHWGMLMSNDLRWLPLEAALDPEANWYDGAHMHPLGNAGQGGADPSNLAMTSAGVVAVALGGADQVVVGREQDFSLRRIGVGRRPAALAVSPDERFVYVANMFDDSISVIDLAREANVAEISLGPQAELSPADRGEVYFYDGRLSHDRWMSCHSCHTDGHTSGMRNDNLSDGSFGAPKRVLSLLGVGDTAPFAWNGQVADLETQIRTSITTTMQREDPPSDDEVQSLAAYLRTLAPPPSLDESRGVSDASAVARGQKVFHAQKCDRCHAPPAYTSSGLYDVGLEDAQGNRRFNPPSLRGVSQRGPYFHDNRAARLEDVFRVCGHQVEGDIGGGELADLVAFLRSL